MTKRTAPGTPKLTIDGEPEPAGTEPLSDSEWDGLDDAPDENTANLTKIAQALRNKKGQGGSSASRTQG